MAFNKELHSFQNRAFDFVVYITWFLYIIIALGLSANAPQYLDDLQYYVKIYISLFLIWRFNSFRNINLTYLDRKIALSAGVFLLATTAVEGFLNNYLEYVKSYTQFFKIKNLHL
jgi:hypothetical protein